MESSIPVRRSWLRIMYLYTVLGAGGFGFAMLFLPGPVQAFFRFPPQDPAVWKLFGSFLFASGLLALPALLYPLKFVPLLVLQLVYKPVWIVVAALPVFLKGQFPLHIVGMTIIFVTYIAGDIIAIPFRFLFSKA